MIETYTFGIYEDNSAAVFRDITDFVLVCSAENASIIADILNTETAPLHDAIATKDAVITAQSERIAELERALRKIDIICERGGTNRIPAIEQIIMDLALAESEAVNG